MASEATAAMDGTTAESTASDPGVADAGHTLDIARIMHAIPHRYPFLLIDRMEEVRHNHSAVGIKNVSINEPFFTGHFPNHPVMPGVLIIEAMAQTAAVLVVETLGPSAAGKLVYFMTIENAKFRRPVVPGDQLRVHVTKERQRANVWKFSGVARVDGVAVAEASYAAMILG
jgi:3-hydroxyacyl-[acyl-carrier-protein] dehydratase